MLTNLFPAFRGFFFNRTFINFLVLVKNTNCVFLIFYISKHRASQTPRDKTSNNLSFAIFHSSKAMGAIKCLFRDVNFELQSKVV